MSEGIGRRGGLRATAIASLLALVILLAGATAGAGAAGAAATPAAIGPWHFVSRSTRLSLTSDQGLTTMIDAGHATTVYRGELSIPLRQRFDGWDHVGDPDSWQGYVFDAYEGNSRSQSKMFLVTTPSGSRSQFVHPLVAGEKFNNPFVAVSPDGRWMVAGEWGTMTRLLVFPTPMINPAARTPSAALEMATTIRLDRPLRDLQGCDFLNSTRLVCASDDPSSDLWPSPHQLLEIDLTAPLQGRPVVANVSYLGAVPEVSRCRGSFEVEGDDYDTATGILRFEVLPPGACHFFTDVYAYRL